MRFYVNVEYIYIYVHTFKEEVASVSEVRSVKSKNGETLSSWKKHQPEIDLVTK